MLPLDNRALMVGEVSAVQAHAFTAMTRPGDVTTGCRTLLETIGPSARDSTVVVDMAVAPDLQPIGIAVRGGRGSRHAATVDQFGRAFEAQARAVLCEYLRLGGNFESRAESVLSGQGPGPFPNLQLLEVVVLSKVKMTAFGAIEGDRVITRVAVDDTLEVAVRLHDQEVVTAAQVEGVAVAAVDQSVVGHLVGLLADEAHAKALQAANGAVVFQEGGPLRRIMVAVTHLDAMIRAADGAFGVLGDCAAAQGDTFAGMGAAVLIHPPAAFTDNLADVVNLRVSRDPYAIAVGIQGAGITREDAVVGDLAGALGMESRAVEPAQLAAVRECSQALGADAVTPAREAAAIGQRDIGDPEIYAVMMITADFPVVDDAPLDASADLDGVSGRRLNVAVTMIGVVD